MRRENLTLDVVIKDKGINVNIRELRCPPFYGDLVMTYSHTMDLIFWTIRLFAKICSHGNVLLKKKANQVPV